MPVTTRSLSEKTENGLTEPNTDAIMATPKPKELTLQDILNSIDSLETRLTAKMDEQVKTLQETQAATNKITEKKISGLEKAVNDQSDEMSRLHNRCDRQSTIIEKLESKVENLENRQRNHNMLIEGLKETNNENLRMIIDEMLQDLGVSFTVEWIDSIYRVGPKRKPTDRRPVMLTFPFVSYKFEIFRNAYQLKDMEKWKGIYLQDDLSLPEQLKKKENRAIFAFAKSQGIDVKMRGSHLIIDGVKYRHDEVLPHDLTIEKAKTVKVKDGLAFQGKHAPLSNLHRCEFKFEGRDYTSSEQALQYKYATVCKQTHVATKILETDDSYDIMRLEKKLDENDEWNKNCVTYLRPILKAKFDQNPHLKAKLTAEKGHFYEATTHPVFGAGITLAKSSLICKENVTTGNKMGEELENLRDQYIGQEVNKDVGTQ